MFVCYYVCLFVCSFVCLFDHLFVRLFVCSLACLLTCLFVCLILVNLFLICFLFCFMFCTYVGCFIYICLSVRISWLIIDIFYFRKLALIRWWASCMWKQFISYVSNTTLILSHFAMELRNSAELLRLIIIILIICAINIYYIDIIVYSKPRFSVQYSGRVHTVRLHSMNTSK